MNWKSTAAASGVMLIGTWLASHAPVGGPRPESAAAPSASRTEAVAAEIQREAHRLHDRLQQAAAYRQPARNPFRFNAEHAPVTPPAYVPAVTVEDLPASSVPVQPTLRLALSGIAEDEVNDEIVRTAIISTPENVFLVTTGGIVADAFKVIAITADAVDLTRLDDGSTVRLTLKQ